MRNATNGFSLLAVVCCIWPLAVHFAIAYLTSPAKKIFRIDWEALKENLPWRKPQ